MLKTKLLIIIKQRLFYVLTEIRTFEIQTIYTETLTTRLSITIKFIVKRLI